MARRRWKSDSQANAEALSRRSATYADENAASLSVKFDRKRYRPRGLRDYVHQLRRAYSDEVPARIHVHQTDDGGTPAWAPEFSRYLTAPADAGAEVFDTPFRAALSSLERGREKGVKFAAIVGYVVIAGMEPAESAIRVGVPPWCADEVAYRALEVFWDRMADRRLDTRTRTAA